MANTKISEMEEATSISENDILPIVKDGSNKKASIKTVFKTVQGFLVPDSIPIGMVVEFPSDNIPDNWLLCNGQAVSRTDYAELFAAIGTTWGTGDGSTTFNVPTKEGLVTVGKKESDSDFNTLGKTGGEKTHTLTVNEMPKHSHTYNKSSGASDYKDTDSGTAYGDYEVNTSIAGGDQPHNNLQPYTVSNFIIKAKQSSGVVATVVDNLNSTSATNALSAKQGKELNDKISEIIESGSNSNGNYIKFSDGTMMCTKSVIVSTKIENPWGNLFESSQLDLGNFPVSFIETPVLSVNKTIGRGSWLELVEGTTNSAIGNTYLVSAVSTTSTTNITINIIAIGKWK